MKKFKKLILIFIVFKVLVLLFDYAYDRKYFQIFNIDGLATEDVQLNDLYYGIRSDNEALERDKDVVLINSGSIKHDNAFRKNLALLIDEVAKYKPRNIGLDFYFESPEDPYYDSLLNDKIHEHKAITAFDIQFKHKNIFRTDKKGFANLPVKNNETVRQYWNYSVQNNETLMSFASVLCGYKAQDSIGYLKYCSDNKGFYNALDPKVAINHNNFPSIEAITILDEIDSFQIAKLLKNKIVIIGHLGTNQMDNPFDVEDKFRVPTDTFLFNRMPIMPGPVIHANAVQMMLSKEHIYALEGWPNEIVTAIILFVFLYVFYTMRLKYKLSRLINFSIILVSTFFIILISSAYLMDIDFYFKVGGLCAQISFLEGFIDIEDELDAFFSKKSYEEKK